MTEHFIDPPPIEKLPPLDPEQLKKQTEKLAKNVAALKLLTLGLKKTPKQSIPDLMKQIFKK